MKIRLIATSLIISVIINTEMNAQNKFAEKVKTSSIEQRVSELRMGDIIIKARPGAEVKVQQVRHEFLFGAALTDGLAEKDKNAMSAENRKMYLKILGENFNYAVHENALKWYDTEIDRGKVDYYLADRIWDICHEMNIPMRGHCLFWDRDEYIMPWLNNLNNDELKAAIDQRAVSVTQHFRGRIKEYDLNNEMIQNDFFRRRLGWGIVNEMAYAAKSGDPDITLYVNDYGILADGGFNAGAYITQIKNLIASGVPVGGIGCQGHPATSIRIPMSAEHVQKTLDTLATFKLPIKITEAQFIAPTAQEEADELKLIFPVYFAHPAVEAIIMWGFWEGDMWRSEAALWKKDWTPTAQGLAYRELVFGKWWTQVSGKTDKDGTLKVHAFYGDYEIISDGKIKKVSFGKKDKSIQVKFE
jgi:endo-1,4-beta-xylanase